MTTRNGHLLRFTGACNRNEIERLCAEQDRWNHSYYFDNGFAHRGDWDLGADIASWAMPADLGGMSVLDVGTGSGWLAAYCEQRGANVTAIDIRGRSDLDLYGRPEYPDLSREKPTPDLLRNGREIYYSPFSKGFWVMKDILGLKADYVNARVYDLRPRLFGGRTFDLVLVGSLLSEVRDPIGALMAIRSVANGTLLANSPSPPHDPPGTAPWTELVRATKGEVYCWRPTRVCLQLSVEAAGFQVVSIEPTKATADRDGIANLPLYQVHAKI